VLCVSARWLQQASSHAGNIHHQVYCRDCPINNRLMLHTVPSTTVCLLHRTLSSSSTTCVSN
jgi:hypothetical protein